MSAVSVAKVRSSLREVFCKKGVLRNFTKFTGKPLCQSLFFNKLLCEIFKKPFLTGHLWWLLLESNKICTLFEMTLNCTLFSLFKRISFGDKLYDADRLFYRITECNWFLRTVIFFRSECLAMANLYKFNQILISASRNFSSGKTSNRKPFEDWFD